MATTRRGSVVALTAQTGNVSGLSGVQLRASFSRDGSMLRWIWRFVAFVAVLCVVAAFGTTYEYIEERRDLAAAPPPGRLIDVGGHRLHLWCLGQGAPTVVFDSGLGGTAFDWYAVLRDVSGFTTACAYDGGHGIQRCWTAAAHQSTDCW